MSGLTKREAAEQVIENMPVGVAVTVRDLAVQARYKRFCLTSRQMGRYLKEHENIERLVERPTDRFGRTLTVVKYRKKETPKQ